MPARRAPSRAWAHHNVGVTRATRLEPPYAGMADLLDLADVPVAGLVRDLPGPRGHAAGTAPPRQPEPPPEPPEPLGHRISRRFFALCENPRTRDRTMRLLRSSARSAVGGRLLVAFASRMVFGPVLRSRRLDHATARIELACAQLGGVAVLRYVSRMEPVASMPVEELVAMVGPGVEATLSLPYTERLRPGSR
jgi:hypothetical protein